MTPPVLDDDDDGEESVSSISDSSYSYEEVLGSNDSKPLTECYYNDEELFGGHKPSTNLKSSKCGSSLNRGFMNESLRIEVPDGCRRYTDGELGIRKNNAQKTSTPSAAAQLQKRIHLRNSHVRVLVFSLMGFFGVICLLDRIQNFSFSFFEFDFMLLMIYRVRRLKKVVCLEIWGTWELQVHLQLLIFQVTKEALRLKINSISRRVLLF